jgi:hypothetical protein
MKPDWSTAPVWAKFFAIDGSGRAYWHETLPKWDVIGGEWNSEGEVARAATAEESLERRP